MARLAALFLIALTGAVPAAAEVVRFPAPAGAALREMVIYSSLDANLAAPLVEAFQARNPGVAVRYEDLLAAEIADRVRAETDAGGPTADFAFSSGMDLQIKLANDGYAQPVDVPAARGWPRWANWRDTAFALTYEPAVLVYHKPSFPEGPPRTRFELLDWLAEVPEGGPPRVGTYDIARSQVGYLFLARDVEHFPDIWSLIAAMGRAGVETYPTSQEILDRVADGRLVLGYNILGSYAADQARLFPDLGIVLLKDYTVVVSRVALVPRAARSPDLGSAFAAFLMSGEGQAMLSEKLRLPALGLDVSGAAGSGGMRGAQGSEFRPVPVSPGLLSYIDQSRRRLLLRKWSKALSAASPRVSGR